MYQKYIKNMILGSTGFAAGNSLLRKHLNHFIDTFKIDGSSRLRIKRRSGQTNQILIYHRVIRDDDPLAMAAVTAQNFEEQMRLIQLNYNVISLDSLVEHIEQGKLPERSICITFDDGYKDNYDYAFPVLKRYKIPATIFLTTDYISTKKMPWFDRVLQAIKTARINRLNLKTLQLSLDLENEKSRAASAFQALEFLKKYNPLDRDRIIEEIIASCQGTADRVTRLMLNWEEIIEMSNSGILFGAHTKSHPILATITENEIDDEISGSKRIIESKTGRSVTTFAYPNGRKKDYDSRCKAILIKGGFKCAVTTNPGNNTLQNDLFELNRFIPWDKDPRQFVGRILVERFLN